MGASRKKSSTDINSSLASMMVPKDFLFYFDIFDVKEKSNEWQIILHEKQDLVPDELKQITSSVVLDGFCNPLQIRSHCFSLKPIYLMFYRRRWKLAGTDKHYSNQYTIAEDGAKVTSDLAGFLKI
jgi:hypothetical protein